jgi:hypothetical protein
MPRMPAPTLIHDFSSRRRQNLVAAHQEKINMKGSPSLHKMEALTDSRLCKTGGIGL